MNKEKYKEHSKVLLHSSDKHDIFEILYINKSGKSFSKVVIDSPGACLILAEDIYGNLLMLKQYRKSIDSFAFELPAGTIKYGETPIQCATRELKEETGFKAYKWRSVFNYNPFIGISNEVMHIFIAEDLEYFGQDTDDDEEIYTFFESKDNIRSMFLNGDIRDAKTIISLYICGVLSEIRL